MTGRQRILITVDAVGGVWQYGTDLARALSKCGIEVVLTVLGPSPTKVQTGMAESIGGLVLVDTGLPLDWMALNNRAVRAAGDAIANLAEVHAADLIHMNAPALAAESEFPVPVLAVNHSCVTTWWEAVNGCRPGGAYRWRGRMTGKGLAAADRVVAPTAAFAEATRKAHGLKVRPTPVHNGRSRLPLPDVERGDFVFTAGRLWDRGKNVATLDRVAARLSIPLHAAGPLVGPNGASVELEHARSLGSLAEEELGAWLAARPVFVSAAIYEPFGLAVAEAAAAGCPLVLADIPTFRELWDGAALFVDPTNDVIFAEAVRDIIGDALLRERLGAAAHERATLYTPDAMAAHMQAIYAEMISSCTAPARPGLVAA